MNAGSSAGKSDGMWPYHPDLLSRPVPRYTSFPTAAEFTASIGAADQVAALAGATGDISLYVHIPFCEQICWYCGCNTGRSNKVQRLANYLDSLGREIGLLAQHLPSGARIRRVAFGGGSPNAIAPFDFVRLVDTLTVRLPLHDPVLSIELDPRNLGPDWKAVLRCVGVTRASLGVQTFAPHLQAAIGRVQPDHDIARGTELLRAAGITSLNYDLMYGLPGQTETDLAETLARSVALGADRIALFGYAHVPHLIPRQGQIDASDLPGQEARFRMAGLGYRQLGEAGYQPVGFDHFALPGDALAQAAMSGRLRRNFQGFTEDQADVLVGLGASAISQFPGLIAQNEKNAGRYRMLLSQDLLPTSGGVRRSARDRALGAIIEGLLCHHEAELDAETMAAMLTALTPFGERGLVETRGSTLVIRPEGLPYARTVAALFDPYRQHSARRFSSAV